MALKSGDLEAALTLVNQIQEQLTEQLESNTAESEETPVSADGMSDQEIVREIYDLEGTEFTIFGTADGLKVPLSAVVKDNRQLAGQEKDFASYEKGREKESVEDGIRLFINSDGRKTVEIVQHSRDASRRFGFKGIEIIFPVDDKGVADAAAADEATLYAAVLQIWRGLATNISSDQRKYFTPK